MTIQFNCPNCNALIAFDSKHSGKRARCITCGQIFIIPSKAGETPKKIKPEPERTAPEPGFYRAVFVESWKIFFDSRNALLLIFVIIAVSAKFFLARTYCCGNFLCLVIWGWLLGFYLNIIYESALGIDVLPEIYLGTTNIFSFISNVLKPFAVFLFTMILCQLPFIIALILLQDKGLTCENMWQGKTGLNLLLQVLFAAGLFLFPMAILTTAVGKDFFMLLRPDYILKPIFKAFIPYIIITALLAAACTLEIHTAAYSGQAPLITAHQLSLNLAVQVVAIIAMRSIGLFYRHYTCYFCW